MIDALKLIDAITNYGLATIRASTIARANRSLPSDSPYNNLLAASSRRSRSDET
jgi:hypothetical protein